MADSTAKTGNKENPVKMLLPTPTTVVAAPTVPPAMPSPTGENMDDNPNNLITYLHQLAGNHEIEMNVIMIDHCYARPWNWKPENIYVKPAKKLFFPKIQNTLTSTNKEEFIDVEDVHPNIIVSPFDLSKAKQSMDEFQRVANFVRSEDADDWEEKIDKILWSPVQNRIFSRIVRILNSERIARLAKVNSHHEAILRRTSIDLTAKRFRETLASANWDWRITQWLHSLLFDYLPQEYLAIYLDILQALRQKIPQLIDKMVAVQPNINSKGGSVTWETLGPLLKKSWDPVAPTLNANKPKKLPGNPILIVTPNGMSSNMSSRQYKWITLLGSLGMVITVNPHLGLTANRMTMMAGLEQLVQACRAKIQDVRVDYPGRPIVLVGFNTGGALASQIAQLEHVTAVVCVGFPMNTVDGKRGSPDDTLLDLRCPVMFVIGQNSMLARIDDIEDLRERMLVPTSLVVVGSADDHLRISTSKKIAEKISQSMVDRCILDEVADFVGGILLQPHPLPLRSPSTLNNYESRKREFRKRKNSTSSSVDSEPQSPNLSIKKIRAHSPMQHGSIVSNNVTGIATNVLPRGTLVALTGTAATQTPRRKARTYGNQNFSTDKLITSRLTTQPNIESSGGITLNIGSFASLAPVGPIRFEPTSISLQTSPANKSSNSLKTSNAFIKVPKSNQTNLGGTQNVAKIKMLMPTKKVSQKVVTTFKNINNSEKTGDMNLVNVLTSTTSASLKVNAPVATVTNMKTNTGTSNSNNLPTIHPPKNQAVASGTAAGKSTTSSSILFTPKNSPMSTTATTTTTSTTPAKVADISSVGGSRKHSMFRSCQQDQLPSGIITNSLTAPSVMTKTRSPKGSRPVPKISLKSTIKPSKVQMSDKSLKVCPGFGSTDTIQNYTTTNQLNSNLDDDLGNILDIPIIIAKDGENLNNLERLSPIPPTPITLQSDVKSLPVINSVGSKLVFINNRNVTASTDLQQTIHAQGLNQIISTRAPNSITLNRGGITTALQPTIKYTKIILTKRSDHDDKSSPVILTKTNRRTNKLLVLDSNNEIKCGQRTTKMAADYVGEIKDSTNSENLSVTNQPSNVLNLKQSYIELNAEGDKQS